MKNKGFSLIELIIVIAIMAILVAIIAPSLTKYIASSKKETDQKNIDEVIYQVQHVISDSVIQDVEVMTTEIDNQVNTAEYVIKVNGRGSSVSVKTNGVSAFAQLIEDNINDQKIVSKVDSSNDQVLIEIKGSKSLGYKIKAVFSKNN